MKRMGEASSVAERRVEAILGQVSDWQNRTIAYAPALDGAVSPIHRGVASQAWQIALDDGAPAFFMKIRHDDMAAFVNVAASFKAAQVAAAAGVTPMPRYLIGEAAIFDMLPPSWDWARLHRFQEPAIVERTVAAKKAIQSGADLGRPRDIATTLTDYVSQASEADVALPPDIWWLIRQAQLIGEAIGAAGMDRRPCHLDGVASNVMIGLADEIQLVDFDSAGDADPHWDLGTVMTEICQFEEEEAALVELYAGTHDRRIHHRARLYGAADDVAQGLWGYLAAASSARSHVEFVKYGEWRFLRARLVMHDPRFEAMLRHV